eukprot:TRINITY_DN2628_c0_g1_i2.p1 TRINITY_DN2628_c0_g1~~TRINITY_DN2628_c0_g1_i2.p1  ORF type:complete len:272 (+),score=65.78 TRINITY_DN2628_c0_g1_i2:43-858(+)
MSRGGMSMMGVGGGGGMSMAAAAALVNPQKPIRPYFKVPYEGTYEIIGDEISIPPKPGKKPPTPVAPSRLSFLLAPGADEDDTLKLSKDKEAKTNNALFFTYNIGESMPFYYFSSIESASCKERVPLGFRVIPTTHDFNQVTSTCSKLDLLIGFDTGDILILLCEPLKKAANTQCNKDKTIATGKVTKIQWMPGSTTQFIASFASGCLVFMDTEREDPPSSSARSDPSDGFSIVKGKNPKHNPVSKWNISSKAINSFQFSPDMKYLATEIL